ncbi:MAG: oligosaccharide flippase family protein [Muribaculaceae bacterium]|nr:oligosaccharide flippase family protein [Muribaculaceae bacterium]
MAGIKSLVKDTAVYGLSSIIGRFLNWGLVPLYTYAFPLEEYGIVSYLYAIVAVVIVVLNYGMETGFFRYASKEKDYERVYSTSMVSLATTSLLFIALISIFLHPISDALTLPHHADYVWMMGFTVAVDAFTNLPFAYLRFKRKAWTFAAIKLINIGVNIGLNLFFILLCPRINESAPQLISWFYDPLGGTSFGVGWIFLANVISTLVVLICLVPQMKVKHLVCDMSLLKKMLDYSWPLLVLGVAGNLSQGMGQIIIPYLFPNDPEGAKAMVGIYGANIKIAVVMMMFTQAFRYAYEPFIFSKAARQGEDKTQAYCDAMKYFVIFGLAIFLGVMYFLPILKHFISPAYWEGLRVVPIMMIADLCFGVYFNLSLWYKLTDRTKWGMYLSLLGFILMLAGNLILVPAIGTPNGYIGSAWAALISYFGIMTVSYLLGRKYYPIPYEVKRIGCYTLLAALLWGGGSICEFSYAMWGTYIVRTLLLVLYILIVIYYENVPLLSSKLHQILHKIDKTTSKS